MRTRRFQRRGARQSRGQIRAREWDGFTTSPSGDPGEPGRIILTTTNAFNDWAITPGDLQFFYDEPTLVRTIISDQCHAVAANTATSISCSLYVGLIVTRGDVNSPPFMDPQDSTHDWIYWAQWMIFNGGTGDGFINAGPTRNGGDTIDIRAKRKFPDGSGLALYALGAANNSHDVVWAFNARVLLLNN